LIDTYHQAWEDHREASAEGSDNLSKGLRRETGDRKGDAGSLSGLSKPLQGAVPLNQLVLHFPAPVVPALAAASERAGTHFLEFAVIICASERRGST
jgi:hypothetical protein